MFSYDYTKKAFEFSSILIDNSAMEANEMEYLRIPRETIPCSYVVEDRMSRSGILDDGYVYNLDNLGHAGAKTREMFIQVGLPTAATPDCVSFEQLHTALDRLVSIDNQEGNPFASWAAAFLMDLYLRITWE